MKKEIAIKIFEILKQTYPNLPKSFLKFNDPFQLLVAVILSAQCTDKTVNEVTPKLFQEFPDIFSLANANLEKIMEIIKPTGFFKNKAQNIKKCAQILIDKFNQKVPETIEELTQLPGVGRKTANAVTQIAFNKVFGIVVDTHVIRLSNRIGLSKHKDPIEIEQDLMKLFPKTNWKDLSFYLILHGRNVCQARKPKCNICPINDLCHYFKQTNKLNKNSNNLK